MRVGLVAKWKRCACDDEFFTAQAGARGVSAARRFSAGVCVQHAGAGKLFRRDALESADFSGTVERVTRGVPGGPADSGALWTLGCRAAARRLGIFVRI